MAYDPNDWSSIFREDDESQAIPETPDYIQDNQQDDWSTVFTPDQSPAQAIPDEAGWGQGTGWESFEGWKAFKEGAATTGRMIHTTMKAPQRVLTDVASRVTGLPSISDIRIDWDKVPQNKIKNIQRKIRRY